MALQVYKQIDSTVRFHYRNKEYFLPHVIIFDNAERKLGLSQIILRYDGVFQLKNDIRALTEDSFEKLMQYTRKKRIYSNEENLRLTDIIEEGERVIFKVQSVCYEHYLHTNLVLDAQSKGKKTTLRDYLHSQGELESLNDSPLANNLGINILLFTADGSLIMQKRSRKVAFRTGELCPSVSGTMTLIDLGDDSERSLDSIPKLREAFEELGIHRKDIPLDQLHFLGVTRELIRGGEPEIFFFGKTDLSEKEVKKKRENARDKFESEDLVLFHIGKIAFEYLRGIKAYEYFTSIDEFYDKYIDKAGVTLLANIALWVKYRLGTEW